MGAHDRTLEGRPIEPFPIHFDVPGHEIPLSTFIETARQTEAIVRSFNQQFLDGKLQYEFVVLPSDEGSFLSRLGIVLLAGWGVVWTFTDSDIGKAFIKGLTTHEPAHWAEMVGESLRESLATAAHVAPEPEEDEFYCRYGAAVIAEATRAFLRKDAVELKQIGIAPSKFRAAYEAKNVFYQTYSETPGLQAIGFDESPTFPIPRSDFSRLQVALPPEEDEDDEEWLTGTTMLKVTSPNWDREDKQRQWKGRDGRNHERYFKIEDEHFWELVRTDRLDTHIIDAIKVQWAYRGTTEAPRACRVLKVLEFNGTLLSAPLNDDALLSILGAHANVADEQADLFGAGH